MNVSDRIEAAARHRVGGYLSSAEYIEALQRRAQEHAQIQGPSTKNYRRFAEIMERKGKTEVSASEADEKKPAQPARPQLTHPDQQKQFGRKGEKIVLKG